jgi:hypothetical protein
MSLSMNLMTVSTAKLAVMISCSYVLISHNEERDK